MIVLFGCHLYSRFLFICLFIRQFISSSVRKFECSYVRMFVCSFVRRFVCSSVRGGLNGFHALEIGRLQGMRHTWLSVIAKGCLGVVQAPKKFKRRTRLGGSVGTC